MSDYTDAIHEERIEDGLLSIIILRAQAMEPRDGWDGPDATPENLRTVMLATIVELVELLNELNWKAWKQKETEVDKRKVADEFADVLAFLGWLMVHVEKDCGLTASDLAAAYKRKMKIVGQRMQGKVEGYQVKHAEKTTANE